MRPSSPTIGPERNPQIAEVRQWALSIKTTGGIETGGKKMSPDIIPASPIDKHILKIVPDVEGGQC